MTMPRSKVAILRTTPATVLRDYHALMNLAGYQDVLAKDDAFRQKSLEGFGMFALGEAGDAKCNTPSKPSASTVLRVTTP